MRQPENDEKWVVYEALSGPHTGMKSVCTTGEWQALKDSPPGRYVLIREEITDESEAEKLARGTSGDKPPRKTAQRPKFEKIVPPNPE